MKDKLRLLPVAIVALAVVAMAACLLVFENNLLWKVQERSIFIYTSLFFKQQLVVAGGFLSWLGSYFTQYLYHPWMGVVMLGAWWVLLVFLSAKAFKVKTKWLVILVVPVALLLIANVTLDYWVYYIKLKGYFFVPVIGMTLAVALVWLYRCITPKYYIRTICLVLLAFVAYPLMGFYGLVAIALMALLALRLTDMSMTAKVVNLVVATVCALAVPVIFYRFAYHETNIDNIYAVALPLFKISETYNNYYIPYGLLVAFYALLAIACNQTTKSAEQLAEAPRDAQPANVAKQKKGKQNQNPRKQRAATRKGGQRILPWLVAQACIVALVAFGVWHFWYKDVNYHKELSMARCLEVDDWDGILAEAKEVYDEPTRAMVAMKNLALFRNGLIGDEMYYYRIGSKESNTPIVVRMMQVVGKQLYFHYGLVNYCFRWCMEDGVEYGNCAEFIKYMAKCSLMNEEWKLAEKYINILKNTKYHRAWAEQQEKYLHNKQAMLKDKTYETVSRLMGYDDTLNSDNSIVEYYLMYHLTRLDSEDPLVQELSLVGALWTKDIQTFWPRFFRYTELHNGQHIPRHYQEAAYLYGHLENQVDISKMPFDKEVVQTYANFMKMAQQQPQGTSEAALHDLMIGQFGHTFFFDYFLNRDQKLY
ncbi:MAG: hypothetical protein IKH88_05200 [Prevotella sp.]|nr:hypothetical protein [Prevotella sp.]